MMGLVTIAGIISMVDLPEDNATYPTGIRQIESREKATGGDTTLPPNEQLLTLANRTAFLKATQENIQATQATKQDQNANLDQLSGLSLIADQLLGTDGAANLILKTLTVPTIAIAVLQDNKSSFAGTGSAFTWQRRDLNNLEQIGGNFCTLSNNQFTLTAGSYGLLAFVPATMVDAHQCRLWNANGFLTKLGASTQTVTAASISGQSLTTFTRVLAAFTISASATFEIQHYIKDTLSDRSLGAETGIGSGEVYTQVFIIRIGTTSVS